MLVTLVFIIDRRVVVMAGFGVFPSVSLMLIILIYNYRYAPYYAYGCAGLVWFCFWLWLAFESPAKHPSISPREQYYIEQSIGSAKTDSLPTIFNTPWGKVFTSMPVWAIIVANFARQE